jgi:hypothetical protein
MAGVARLSAKHSVDQKERRRMARERVALVACLVLVSLSLISSQSAEQPTVLSELLRTHLRGEQFVAVTAVAGLPNGIREGLRRLFGRSTLELAEPGAEFQVTDVIMKPNLPIRRLISAGCSADHCLVYYERGGIAHTRYVVLFKSTKTGAQFEWGGSAPAGLADLDEVKGALLSGEVRGQTKYW